MEPSFRAWYKRKMLATEELAEETKVVKDILTTSRVIAIVGISKNPHKDSHYVGRYLKAAGYTVVPVNPTAKTILEEPCYPSLSAIPFPVDVVDVFRKPSEVMDTVTEAIRIGAKTIWLQLGTGTHLDALTLARSSGRTLIQNRCMKVDHQFILRPSGYTHHKGESQ